MRMGIYISLVVVCSLLSFIAANTISYKSGISNLLATVSAQAGLGQCPPCPGICTSEGVSASTSLGFPEDCTVNSCNGSTIKNRVVLNGLGRDIVIISKARCTYFDNMGHEQSCGDVEDQTVLSNVCCPVGQAQPHYECNFGGGCDLDNSCGSDKCEPGVRFCPCDAGEYSPHLECDGNTCRLAEYCGTNECDNEGGSCGGETCGACSTDSFCYWNCYPLTACFYSQCD